QTISQPYIVALMTELLELKGGEKVLEVGTGSGYQAAVLSQLAKNIYTIEIIPELAGGAERLLKNLGYENIKIKVGDGWLGWEDHAPFDAIIVTCAPGEMPLKLIEQLAENGRMVLPLGTGYQELKLIRKINGVIKIENIASVRFVPMIKKMGEKK
ncbi:MAG: protein-L-isoaspartate(D-aspartate) O-methyltransferase, partial [Elusimicrobiales bacterium]|nr:protein-L-isoaspartate(D-aspartate) O-methyltransferase [Elusimicrobiales bacterium]